MARAAKIDVRTGAFLRPPLTRHRLGYPVNLLQPKTAGAALRALLSTPLDLDDRVNRAGLDTLEPDAMGGRKAECADSEDNREKQPLSPRMQQLLAKGDIHSVYFSRSEVIQAITTDAVRQGWNPTEVFEVLMNPENIGGERLHEIAERSGDEAALAWLERGYLRAEGYINRAASVSGERLSHWSRYATRAITGRSATSDRLILQALLDLAEQAWTLRVNASIRQLADMAGLAKGTARVALRRLRARDVFHVVGDRQVATDALTYELIPEVLDALADSIIDPRLSRPHYLRASISADTALSHDLWRNRSGLGKGTGLTWLALGDQPQSVSVLAKTRGVGEDTIRRHLKRLESAVLALHLLGGWVHVIVEPEYLDSLAADFGVLGKGEHQKQVHEAERTAFQTRQRKYPAGKRNQKRRSRSRISDPPSTRICL